MRSNIQHQGTWRGQRMRKLYAHDIFLVWRVVAHMLLRKFSLQHIRVFVPHKYPMPFECNVRQCLILCHLVSIYLCVELSCSTNCWSSHTYNVLVGELPSEIVSSNSSRLILGYVVMSTYGSNIFFQWLCTISAQHRYTYKMADMWPRDLEISVCNVELEIL